MRDGQRMRDVRLARFPFLIFVMLGRKAVGTIERCQVFFWPERSYLLF